MPKQLYRFEIGQQLSDAVYEATDVASGSHVRLLAVALASTRDREILAGLEKLAGEHDCECFSDGSSFYFVAQSDAECAELRRQVQERRLEYKKAAPEKSKNPPQPPPVAPPPSVTPAPRVTRTASSKRAIIAVAAVIFVSIVLVIAVAVDSSRQAARQQEEEQQRQAQAQQEQLRQQQEQQQEEQQKAAQEQAERQLVAAAQEHSDQYEDWLRKRREAMEPSVHTLKIENECPTDTIRLAIRFEAPDDSGRWVTSAWWYIKPGQSLEPAMATANRQIYFYAESDTKNWGGGPDAINVSVVSNNFVQVDGEPLQGKDVKTVSMRHVDAGSDWGEYSETLTCSR